MEKSEYYTAIRDDIIEMVPDGVRRILEVGCGAGFTGRAIKENRKGPIEVTGIEIEAKVAEKAKENIDRVMVGNVETMELPFEKGYFDCIIYGDVLEHLVDPWNILIRHCGFLKKNGYVVMSIPNIAHYRTIKMLCRKEWNYEDRGILDKNHLRFFALNNIKEMLRNADLGIVRIKHKLSGSKSKKILNKMFCGALSDYLTEQYIILARK